MLTVDSVSVHYGRVQALRDVSLEVKQGEIVTLVGANGAGKTTLLNTIFGAQRQSAGHVTFEGHRLDGVQAEKMAGLGIGYVPEGRQVFGDLSVHDNLVLGGYSRYQLSWKPTITNLRHILGHNSIEHDMETIHTLFPILKERKTQKAGSLSGGEQQMLAIGRAMMCNPRLMLLDEPTIGLSPVKAKEILRLVLRLRQMGLTILLVEQNAGAAMKIADRVYVLENGRVTMEGVPRELLADSRVQQAYLGKNVAASPRAK